MLNDEDDDNVGDVDNDDHDHDDIFQSIGSLIPLGLICLIVTFGNILVISAVREQISK